MTMVERICILVLPNLNSEIVWHVAVQMFGQQQIRNWVVSAGQKSLFAHRVPFRFEGYFLYKTSKISLSLMASFFQVANFKPVETETQRFLPNHKV